MIKAVKGLYWQVDAACRQSDLDLFFPRETAGGKMQHPQIREAKALCATCPVKLACLDWALEHGETEHGVWGGKTPHERRTEQRRRRSEEQEHQLGLPNFQGYALPGAAYP